VESFLVAELLKRYPDDGIVGEEGFVINPTAARQWVIDPIDGTFNFVRKMDQWAVSIGLFENGKRLDQLGLLIVQEGWCRLALAPTPPSLRKLRRGVLSSRI